MANDEERETLDFNKPNFEFQPNEAHEWRQQGPYLICKGCELTHAVYIGVGKMMVGTDKKGKPILKSKRSVIG